MIKPEDARAVGSPLNSDDEKSLPIAHVCGKITLF